MSKFPRISGAEMINVLVKEFGFKIVRQTGSHVILRKFVGDKKTVTVVPQHQEIKTGTALGILALASIKKDEFLSKL